MRAKLVKIHETSARINVKETEETFFSFFFVFKINLLGNEKRNDYFCNRK